MGTEEPDHLLRLPDSADLDSRRARRHRNQGNDPESDRRELRLAGFPADAAAEIVDRFGGITEAADYAARADRPAPTSRATKHGHHGNELLSMEGVGHGLIDDLARRSPFSNGSESLWKLWPKPGKDLGTGEYSIEFENGDAIEIERVEHGDQLPTGGYNNEQPVAWMVEVDPFDELESERTGPHTKAAAMNRARRWTAWRDAGADTRTLPREFGEWYLVEPANPDDITPSNLPNSRTGATWATVDGHRISAGYMDMRSKSKDDKSGGWHVKTPDPRNSERGSYTDWSPESREDAIAEAIVSMDEFDTGGEWETSEHYAERAREIRDEINQTGGAAATGAVATDGGSDYMTEKPNPAEVFDSQERGQIKHHAEQGRTEQVLSVATVPKPVADAALKTWDEPAEILSMRGRFEEMEGVGPTGAARLEAVAQLVDEAINDNPRPRGGTSDVGANEAAATALRAAVEELKDADPNSYEESNDAAMNAARVAAENAGATGDTLEAAESKYEDAILEVVYTEGFSGADAGAELRQYAEDYEMAPDADDGATDGDTYDPTDEWSDGQQGLTDGQIQASFDAPAPADGDSEIESIDELNDGGLMADVREDTGGTTETAQDSLIDLGPEQHRDDDQGGLDSFGSSDDADDGADEPGGLGAATLADAAGNDGDEWATAVHSIRADYGDSYQQRIELGADLGRHSNHEEMESPRALGSEGVLQPLIRFQDVPPEDVESQIRKSVDDEDDAEAILAVIESYGTRGADADQGDDEPANQAADDPADEPDESDREKLLEVEGIGPAKADTLLDAFDDLRGVSRKASSSTVSIARLDGFSPDTAGDLFHKMQDAGVYVSMDDAAANSTSSYDPIEDLADDAKEMAQERKRPVPDPEREAVFSDGDAGAVDRREIPESGLSLSDITDWGLMHDEREDPDKNEVWDEMMGDIYDPTAEGAEHPGSADPDLNMIQKSVKRGITDANGRSGAKFSVSGATDALDDDELREAILVANWILGYGNRYDPDALIADAKALDDTAPSLNNPAPWTVVDEHADADRDDSLLVEHPDGYLVEIWERDLADNFDVEYVDPSGTRRDGSGSFHETAQGAFDAVAPHITEVRAESRERAEQDAEQASTEWPAEMGRYVLNTATASDTNAEYDTRYLKGTGVLGREYGDDNLTISFFEDTRKYHVDGERYARKSTAIDAAREVLKERTEKYDEIEADAQAEVDDDRGESETDKFDAPAVSGWGPATSLATGTVEYRSQGKVARIVPAGDEYEVQKGKEGTTGDPPTLWTVDTVTEAVDKLEDEQPSAGLPTVEWPQSLAEAVDRNTDADGWQPHEWNHDDGTLHAAEYDRRGTRESVVVYEQADAYNVVHLMPEDAEDGGTDYATTTVADATKQPVDAIVDGLNSVYGDEDSPLDEPAKALPSQPVAAEYGLAKDIQGPDEEIENEAIPPGAPTTPNGWTISPTGYTHIRYSADVDMGGLVVTAETQKSVRIDGEDVQEMDAQVTAYDAEGEFIDWDGIDHGIMGREDALATVVDYVESTDPEDAWATFSQADAAEVEFGKKTEANEWRDANESALHPNDDRRYKTVVIEGAEQAAIEDAEDAALVSKGDETKDYGQADLTDAERNRLQDRDGWTWGTHGFHAQAVKGMMEAEGVSDWTAHYQKDLTVDEHRSTVLDTAIEDGGGSHFEAEDSEAEKARQAEKVDSQACDSAADAAAEDGDQAAIDHLMSECGYTREEVEELRESFETIDEVMDDVLGEGAADDPAVSFDEWAASAEPEASQPSDDELAKLAPTTTDDPDDLDELPAPALRALSKAWGGYKTARAEHREAQDRAEHYAGIINGVRAVNGQDPLSFDALDGWTGGDVISDDPTEDYPTEDGQMTIEEAADAGRTTQTVQGTISAFTGDVYDPTTEF